jgi:hypothetical protein
MRLDDPTWFRRALAEAEMSKERFSWMFGTNYRNVQRWYKGGHDIPPWVPLAMVALCVPESRSLMMAAAKGLRGEEPPR